MQQSAPGPDARPIRIMFGDLEVAGYFEEGRWVPCTFAEFIRLVQESPNGHPPEYLKPVKGFAGVTKTEISTLPFIPIILTPHFCEGDCRGSGCDSCKHGTETRG